MTRLSPGDPAPNFTLPDADGKDVSLADLRGHKVIIYFYPAAMTPGCTTQACDFRDSLDSLAAAGFAVLGVSPDTPEKLARFRDRDAVTFPLLSDASKATLEAYGAFGETPSTANPAAASESRLSRKSQACVVQPGVIAAG